MTYLRTQHQKISSPFFQARAALLKGSRFTMETMDDMIHEAGFEITDRCTTKKNIF